jgi:hypothetical protein
VAPPSIFFKAERRDEGFVIIFDLSLFQKSNQNLIYLFWQYSLQQQSRFGETALLFEFPLFLIVICLLRFRFFNGKRNAQIFGAAIIAGFNDNRATASRRTIRIGCRKSIRTYVTQ